MKKVAGFTIIEILVATVVLGVILALSLKFAVQNRQHEARAAIVEQYAEDWSIVARAARDYVAANEASWTAGSLNTFTIQNLIAGGYLPAAFGTNQFGSPKTPGGRNYYLAARVVTAGEPSPTVIVESGNENSLTYERTGEAWGHVSINALKRDIAYALMQKGLPAGSILQATKTVVGAGANAWTKPIDAWLGSTSFTHGSAAVLLNFPDLEPDVGPIGGTETGGGVGVYGLCRISKQPVGPDGFPKPYPFGGGNYPAVACGSGPANGMPGMADVPYEIAQINTCAGVYSAAWNPQPYASQGIGGFSVTFGGVYEIPPIAQAGSAWETQCPSSYPECGGAMVTFERGEFTLNNMTQDNELCNATYRRRNTYFPYSTYDTTSSARWTQLLCCENPG